MRWALTVWVGPGLPTYITFYPAVIVVALLAGLGPGLVTTGLVVLTTAYWLLPPPGMAVAAPVDRLGLALFVAMVNNGGVQLEWRTGSETENMGFLVYRAPYVGSFSRG